MGCDGNRIIKSIKVHAIVVLLAHNAKNVQCVLHDLKFRRKSSWFKDEHRALHPTAIQFVRGLDHLYLTFIIKRSLSYW